MSYLSFMDDIFRLKRQNNNNTLIQNLIKLRWTPLDWIFFGVMASLVETETETVDCLRCVLFFQVCLLKLTLPTACNCTGLKATPTCCSSICVGHIARIERQMDALRKVWLPICNGVSTSWTLHCVNVRFEPHNALTHHPTDHKRAHVSEMKDPH